MSRDRKESVLNVIEGRATRCAHLAFVCEVRVLEIDPVQAAQLGERATHLKDPRLHRDRISTSPQTDVKQPLLENCKSSK